MLLDDNLVFFDGVALTDESTSDPVPLNALFRPGRYHDAIPMVVMLTEVPEGGTGNCSRQTKARGHMMMCPGLP